jgi:hypothetical protein
VEDEFSEVSQAQKKAGVSIPGPKIHLRFIAAIYPGPG